jgi:hypothetical protein
MQHYKDRLRLVWLFGKPYYWDTDRQLDRCSMAAHCFVSDKHTGLPGCVRPTPRLVLAHARVS